MFKRSAPAQGRWLAVLFGVGLLWLAGCAGPWPAAPRALALPGSGPANLAPLAAAEVAALGVSGPYTATTPARAWNGDLRQLPPGAPSVSALRPEVDREIERPGGTANFVDPARQTPGGLLGALGLSPAMPNPDQSFAGLSDGGSCTGGQCGAGWPPDTNGDVGPTYYIQTVNTAIGIYTKTTGLAAATLTFNSLFSAAVSPCNTNNQGDPVVVYDGSVDRWLIADFAWTNIQNGPYYECLAASQSGDPLNGGWWLYTLRTDDASHPYLNDYPKLGVWSDGIYMASNQFDCLNSTCSSATYEGARLVALNRSDLFSGAALRSVTWDAGASTYSLLPANIRGVQPPSAEPEIFASVDPGVLHLWQFQVNWTTLLSSTLTGPTNLAVTSFAWPSGKVPQSGTTSTLDTLGDRLMMQLQYRNRGGTESLWASHTVASGGVTGVRWYEIRSPNSSPSVFQQGTYQPDSTYRWMPSLAVDQQGDMAIGYSASSASLLPGIRYAGRLAGDAVNTLGQGETTLLTGAGAQTGCGCTRWGDYSAMTVDPLDDCTFWYTTEYYAANGSNWQTRIGAFHFAGCGASATATPTLTAATPTPSKTSTVTPTGTATPTRTSTVTATRTSTPTATRTSTSTTTPTQTSTTTPTITPTTTATPTKTSTATRTPTPTSTTTATPAATSTATATATATATSTSTVTPTATGTLAPTSTSTATGTRTATGTATPTATSTATLTATPANTAVASATSTGTSTATGTATPTATNTATLTPTPTSTATGTATLTPTPTETPAETATGTATSTASDTATPTATPPVENFRLYFPLSLNGGDPPVMHHL